MKEKEKKNEQKSRDKEIEILDRTNPRFQEELEKFFKEITPDNIHDEVSTGKPVGREIW